MAAKSPPELLRRALAARRGEGEDFPSAWPPALATALSEAGSATERREWLDALERTRASWQAAYAGRLATTTETALHAIGSDPERVVPLDGRDCALCGEPIPATRKHPSARFCSDRCRRRSHVRAAA